ncbi:SDR family oxidoreductase [Spirosoma rhododendri]|uniref:SDR family oxidoreductase n=1 Tax=Spirosoma rhododendri TaxID=2728024 RepID=A0A7L5DSZ0_9BACT|nr:SDR family oxidoreductase [Spirosoma rhododendri]QJD80722.1 SDR family oxidoreductase [Spirosoma rhododendri]
MILVTGATGHLGGAVVDFLLKKVAADQVAVLVRDAAKAADLAEKGVSVRVGNYHDKASMVQAFQGVDTLLLVSTSDLDDRVGQHLNVINAAKEAGVTRVVYTGVTMQNIDQSPLKDFMGEHFETEENLKKSGLTYTFLRNSLYADVLPMFFGPGVLETGIFLPAGQGRVPYATRENMAEAAANVLAGDGHDNQTYELVNTESWSMDDAAAILSELAGKSITYTDAPNDVYTNVLTNAGVPEGAIGFTIGFANAIGKNDFDLPGDTLTQLLGRKPASLRDYLQTTYFGGK